MNLSRPPIRFHRISGSWRHQSPEPQAEPQVLLVWPWPRHARCDRQRPHKAAPLRLPPRFCAHSRRRSKSDRSTPSQSAVSALVRRVEVPSGGRVNCTSSRPFMAAILLGQPHHWPVARRAFQQAQIDTLVHQIGQDPWHCGRPANQRPTVHGAPAAGRFRPSRRAAP